MAERVGSVSSSRINPDETETNNNDHGFGNVAEGKKPFENFKIEKGLIIDPNHLAITSIINEGCNSIVYEGRYKAMPVAVKIMQLSPTSPMAPEHCNMFLREVLMLSRLRHENLVAFVGASLEPSMMIVTEYMGGGSLQKHLYDMRHKNPDLLQAISYMIDLSEVMEFLHAKGIIHRDIKPSNLLLSEDRTKLKLADFGLAREEELDDLMTSEAGTYRWMAPELLSKVPIRRGVKMSYDHKVDIYSFSIVLWELLTNKAPYAGMSNMQAAYAVATSKRLSTDNVPDSLVPLLVACWAEDPAARPEFTQITPCLKAFLNILRPPPTVPPHADITNQPDVAADPPPPPPETRRQPEKSKKLVVWKKSRIPVSNFLKCFAKCFSG